MSEGPQRKKRVAEFQLTQDNWDQEEEEKEEVTGGLGSRVERLRAGLQAGVFKKADDGLIKERKIISGKRRLHRDAAGPPCQSGQPRLSSWKEL